MKLNFIPMRSDEPISLSVQGDVLTINGEPFDFGPLPEGAILPREAVACEWLASDVTRQGGAIELTLILPHGANAPPETRFPTPIEATEGPIELPMFGATDGQY